MPASPVDAQLIHSAIVAAAEAEAHASTMRAGRDDAAIARERAWATDLLDLVEELRRGRGEHALAATRDRLRATLTASPGRLSPIDPPDVLAPRTPPPTLPPPSNESARVATLRALHVLDTPPEPFFDDVALLAAQICETPVAVVALIDSDRQWFKARVGFGPAETARDISFCTHAVAANEPLVVEETRADARFAANPFVTGGPKIRFYAGYPLRVGASLPMGTLCVFDVVPRVLSSRQHAALEALARRTAEALEGRRSATPTSTAGVPRGWKPGSTLGRYTLERKLGSGPRGDVFVATAETAGPVALKVFRRADRSAFDATFVPRPRAPASRHLARLIDADVADDTAFVVTDLVHGTSFAELPRAGSIARAVGLVRDACLGLAAAHQADVVHGNLKPTNLMVDDAGVVKVLDLFTPRKASREPRALRFGDDGAPPDGNAYRSPEQLLSPADSDARSDVWGMGVVLYELVTGALPFPGESVMDQWAAMLGNEVVSPRALRPDVSPALEDCMLRCLSVERGDRPRHAGEVAALLSLATL